MFPCNVFSCIHNNGYGACKLPQSEVIDDENWGCDEYEERPLSQEE